MKAVLTMSLAVLALALAAQPINAIAAETEARRAVAHLEQILAKKGMEFPWSAEYKLSMPPQPRIAGGTEERRFFASARDALYSEETREHYASRVLIRDGEILWEYEDTLVGSLLFRGPANLKGHSPEEFLVARGFPTNGYRWLDADLVARFREILTGADLLESRPDKKQGEERLIFSTAALGPVEILLKPNSIEVWGLTAGKERQRKGLLFRYAYESGAAGWSREAVDSLTARFEQRTDRTDERRVNRLAADFSYISVMEAINESGREKPIPIDELRETAQRLGYFLPESKEATIRTARGVLANYPSRSLELEVEVRGESFWIVQYQPPMKLSMLPESFVKRKRPFGKYTKVDVYDVGTGGRFVYFFGKDVTLLISGEHYENRRLEEVIRSFAKAQPERAADDADDRG